MQKLFTKGTCMRNYDKLYVEGDQEVQPFYIKFAVVIHFLLLFRKCCRSENNIYVSRYDKTSLKLCKHFEQIFPQDLY